MIVYIWLFALAALAIVWIASSWREWLYAKPHIVRFEDGTYGVRRWDVCWEFLGCTEHGKLWHWWSARYPEEWGIFATEAEARGFLVAWRCTQTPRLDIGVKVTSSND